MTLLNFCSRNIFCSWLQSEGEQGNVPGHLFGTMAPPALVKTWRSSLTKAEFWPRKRCNSGRLLAHFYIATLVMCQFMACESALSPLSRHHIWEWQEQKWEHHLLRCHMFSLKCNLAPHNRIDSTFRIEPCIQWVDAEKINFFSLSWMVNPSARYRLVLNVACSIFLEGN